MADVCLKFVPHLWKPNICRDCNRPDGDHSGNARPPAPIVAKPTDVERDKTKELRQQKKRANRNEEERRFIDLVERKIDDLIVQLNLKDKELKKLREDQDKMVLYHRTLEKALEDELANRERREEEKRRMLAVPRQTPGYWGPNAFAQPYREVIISDKSKEFAAIESLLNATIVQHDDSYGTVNGEQPTVFIVKQLRRIQNIRLWHEYCFKKDCIINNNDNRVEQCGSSIYLESVPVLTPPLDRAANEYWLFHGCSADALPELLQVGYDPRVSSLERTFGGGFYLVENSSKANQYIPCPECGWNARFAERICRCAQQEQLIFAMIIYRVVLGDVHVALEYDRAKYSDGVVKNGRRTRVRRPPVKANGLAVYDSVMGESRENGGDHLQQREFVVYDKGQAYPEYVVEFQRSTEDALPPVDLKRAHKRCRHFLRNTFRTVPE